MARLTIEDKWWTDPRRSKLIKLLGGEDEADLAALRLWKLGQQFWGDGHRPIPLNLFNVLEAAPKLIEAQLAFVEGDGVYARGSAEYHSWLHAARKAASIGGKKSAEARRKKTGSAQPTGKTLEAKPKRSRTKTEAKSEIPRSEIEPSVSVSDSVSVSGLDSGSGSAAFLTGEAQSFAPALIEPIIPQTNDVVGAFYSAWRRRYHDRAPLLGKDHKRLKELTDALGGDTAKKLVESYFEMTSSWFTEKRHDVETLMSNLSQVQHYAATGEIITRADAKQLESQTSFENQLRRLGGGL